MQNGEGRDSIQVEIPCLSIDLIDVPEGAFGTLNQQTVDTIAESFRKEGQLQQISVRPTKNPDGTPTERFELIFGNHRLHAAKQCGWSTIRANIRELDDEEVQWARRAENICRNNLEAAAYLAMLTEWKKDYEARHPETVHGAAGGIGKARKAGLSAQNGDAKAGASNEGPTEAPAKSFYKTAAEKTGMSPKTIANHLALAEKLGPEALEVLSMGCRLSKADLHRIASIENESERRDAIRIAACGDSVDDAIAFASFREKARNGKGGEDIRPDKELTDDEWLNRHCSEIMGRLKDASTFKIHALLYRSIDEARARFAKSAKPKLREVLENHKVVGGLYLIARRMAHVAHPKHWKMCRHCGGSGFDGSGGRCFECRGNGFKVIMDRSVK